MKPCLLIGAVLMVLPGCRREEPRHETIASAPPPSASQHPDASVAPAASSAAPARLSRSELGALIERLSERPGDFPSDNFVSNETSYLDVVPALRNPALRDRAYVGVGPEQNLTYLAILEPAIAYLVDIRRGNLLEHLVLRLCFEASSDRVGFVSVLTSRPVPESLQGKERTASASQIAEAFANVKPDRTKRDTTESLVVMLMTELGVGQSDRDSTADRRNIQLILREFYDKGLSAAYAMQGSNRKYPSVGSLLAQTTEAGEPASFLGTHEAWNRVRSMMLSNRVVPVVGDFGGDKALPGVARDMRERGLKLGVFYTSNVEQYLFTDGKYGRFTEHVRAMPSDDASLMLRVWFDQGRKHPRQKDGHRTTSVTMPVTGFLGHKPWRSYWEVATWEPQ